MDFNVIGELIGSFGFPILCCFYMMTTMNKTLQDHTEKTNTVISEMKSTMQTSLTANTDAINQLTLFMQTFIKPSEGDSNE